jgi:hypothetical protein
MRSYWTSIVVSSFGVGVLTALTLLPAMAHAGDEPCLGLGPVTQVVADGDTSAFVIGGDYGVAFNDLGLTVWTFDADGKPRRRGTWQGGRGFFWQAFPRLRVAVDPRGWALAVDENHDLHIFDIRDPDHPKLGHEEMYGTPSWYHPRSLSISGDITSLHGEYLRLVEIEDPTRPPVVRFSDRLVTSAMGGLVGHVLIELPWIDYYRRLIIADVSDPTEPITLASVAVDIHDGFGFRSSTVLWAGNAIALASDDPYTVFNYGSDLLLIDVSEPAAPVVVDLISADEPLVDWGWIATAVFDERMAFVFTGDRVSQDYVHRLQQVDFSDPENPVVIADRDLPVPVVGAGIHDGLLYAMDWDGRLTVFDPSRNLATRWDIGGSATTDWAAFLGQRLLVAEGDGGLAIFDAQDPDAPLQIGHMDLPGYSMIVEVDGGIAAVATPDDGVYLVDILRPDGPVVLATVPTDDEVVDIELENGLLAIATVHGSVDYGAFELVDVSQPVSPVRISRTDTYEPTCTGIAIEDGRAILAAGTMLLQYDISNPTSPQQVGTPFRVVNGIGWGVELLGSTAIIGGVDVSAYDLTDPDVPVELPAWRDLRIEGWNVRAFGDRIVASYPAVVAVIDASDAAAPIARAVASFRPSYGPALMGDRVWVPGTPFLEALSLSCGPPVAQMTVESSGWDVWLESTSAGSIDTLRWNLGDGRVVERALASREVGDNYRLHVRYQLPRTYTITLEAIGPQGTSATTVAVPISGWTPRQPNPRIQVK